MGLTNKSTGSAVNCCELQIVRNGDDKVIALAGNPNVGKSTVFNALTGLNQHTGNWPGKTVCNAQGTYKLRDKNFILVDIPGTYSLMANSAEEEVARDFICFGEPDTTVVVTDATCLERNLNLVLQILEVTRNVVVCVNLMDEAKKKGIQIDLDELSLNLGVPVVATSAATKKGLDALTDEIYAVSFNKKRTFHVKMKYDDKIENAIEVILPRVKEIVKDKIDARWLSIKLLDMDDTLKTAINSFLGFDILEDEQLSSLLKQAKFGLKSHNISDENLRDMIVSGIVSRAEQIYKSCVILNNVEYTARDRKIDRLLTSKLTGIPIMLLLLGFIFWLTIIGANYPSELLSKALFWVEDRLTDMFTYFNSPPWLQGIIVTGMYRTLAWVVSVMLPPMAIFFPLFTLLEDSGYLPRIAFNMDKFFKKACAHGKQALTMCMGFGCNACGVIGCRIIDSPRERLIATLTNNFVPCNGRFPTIIALITMFFSTAVILPLRSLFSALILLSVIVLGVCMTLLVSKLLSKTLLKGVPSSFALELPPYRKPQIGKVVVRSVFDRTLFVLGRAVSVAAPAGLVIWLMSNITVNNLSLLNHCAAFLDPFARLLGLDGIILMAFILGFPANEIVVPIMIMGYMCSGKMVDMTDLNSLRELLIQNGWTYTTAICTILFSLMHFPCATTCITVKKETGSIKWTLISFLLPTIIGMLICFVVATLLKLLNIA
ncbi:MAG: ferrous iron transport protein B [Clostridia bacterium]|nr:ferrous iron transport protein B [Clostridia bacterium]